MAVNKVIHGGKTLIDLTGDTVTVETLADGIIAHDKSGNKITGNMPILSPYLATKGLSTLSDQLITTIEVLSTGDVNVKISGMPVLASTVHTLAYVWVDPEIFSISIITSTSISNVSIDPIEHRCYKISGTSSKITNSINLKISKGGSE